MTRDKKTFLQFFDDHREMHSLFNEAREYLAPVLRDSKFKESGVLTPEEFIAAGDQLVFRCPTWSWYVPIATIPTRNALSENTKHTHVTGKVVINRDVRIIYRMINSIW